MRPLKSVYGGEVYVSESSSAEAPRIWLRAIAPVNLNDPEGPSVEAPIHLELDDAHRLANQLLYLVANHYQMREFKDDGHEQRNSV
jgi:hypothetical protein